MNEQLLKTSGADVLSSKIKTLEGVAFNPTPPPIVRPMVKLLKQVTLL